MTSQTPFDYLGMTWGIRGETLHIDMNKFIKGVEKYPLNKGEDLQVPLTPEQLTAYKSLLAEARWPIAHLIPELTYSVSALAQGGDDKELVHMKALNDVVERLQGLGERAVLRLRTLDLDDLLVMTVMDASFGNEEGKKSQMGYMNILTTKKVVDQSTVANLLEFQSTTITRIVRSTMAAESASLSHATDRQLYIRLLVQSLLFGESDLQCDWREHLTFQGIMVTDAKSLHDHLNKTGSLPTERHTLIDLLVARDLQEREIVKIRRLPNRCMLADVLTKATRPNEVFDKFWLDGMYSLVPTEEESAAEQRRLNLRRGQRDRAKEKKKDLKKGLHPRVLQGE